MSQSNDGQYREVLEHLHKLARNPEKVKLNIYLLKDVDNGLDGATPSKILWGLLSAGQHSLQLIQEEPRPLTRLLERSVALLPFDELKDTISVATLEEGLKSLSPSIALLCLAYLRKASERPSDAAWIGATPSLVNSLITVWLSTASTEIAERSLDAIVALLLVDHPSRSTVVMSQGQVGEAQGQGLFWRRIFQDPEIYTLLFHWTSFRSSRYNEMSKQSVQQATISQARLFDFIVKVAEIDSSEITKSRHPCIETQYGDPEGRSRHRQASLLHYSASEMVDLTDPLMEVLRHDFGMRLIAVIDNQHDQARAQPQLLETIKEDFGDIDGSGQTARGMHL